MNCIATDALLTMGTKLLVNIREVAPGEFRAACPSLIGCVAYGKTRAEVRQTMGQAAARCLASHDVFLLVEDPASLLDFQEG